MMKINDFLQMKKSGTPIVMLTAYDYISGKIASECKVDIILVGDSLSCVIQGNSSTIGVTIEQMIYHCVIVRKAAQRTFLIADMPYGSYHISTEDTLRNGIKLMLDTSANAVKLEGGTPKRIEVIKALVDAEIPVCGHLGLTPQSLNVMGEYKVQAKATSEQDTLISQAIEVQNAGAFMLVLECIPEELGKKVSSALDIPTIGIGAGRYTDGQVMVWHDILGLSDNPPKFVKKYIDMKQSVSDSVLSYIDDVRKNKFPEKKNVYYPIK
jgi:3-methyl-2-oxobutanoate hydroxymethyltransferase